MTDDRYIIECVDCGYREVVDSKYAKNRKLREHDRPDHRVHWKRPSWNTPGSR